MNNAQFVADHYHLLDEALKEALGKGVHARLEHHLRLIVNAETEYFFS